jgi:MerR family mercuric resistance operon transcriptional regulator
MSGFTIGKVAKRAGIDIETIRFYEKEGLVDEPERNPSGYRQYPAETIKRILFIQRAKAIGFTLREIHDLLSIQEKPEACCGDLLSRAESKMAEIEAKINELQRMKNALQMLTTECVGDNGLDNCPILDALYVN